LATKASQVRRFRAPAQIPAKYRHRIQYLDDLSNTSFVGANVTGGAGLKWKDNGIRDAFALYHLKLHGDPRETVRVMGTSLRRLDENYLNITDSVVLADAEEWFAIMPEQVAEILPFQPEEPGHQTAIPATHSSAQAASVANSHLIYETFTSPVILGHHQNLNPKTSMIPSP
jgi:hypothetical protein